MAGGNAVAAWVSRVDEAAVRNTRDVDILIRRDDLDRAIAALEPAGFLYRHVASVDMFLDGPEAKARDAVHLVFAGEKTGRENAFPAPDVEQSEATSRFRLVSLDALVRMKLTAFRPKDQMHLIDLIDVGLIDATWPARLPAPLAERLQELLDSPQG